MDEAKQIELLAMLSYKLLAGIKHDASRTLRASVVKGMQKEGKILLPDQRVELFKSTVISGFITRLVDMDKYGSVDAAFKVIKNKPALSPLLLRGDIFAMAAQGLGPDKFSKFLPAQVTEEDTVAVLNEQSGPFPNFIKALV